MWSCQVTVGMIWKTLEYARNIKTCWLVGRPEGMIRCLVSKFNLISILWKYLVRFLKLIAWEKTVTVERINCYLQIVFIYAKYLLNPIAQKYAFLIKLSRKNDAGMKMNKGCFWVCLGFVFFFSVKNEILKIPNEIPKEIFSVRRYKYMRWDLIHLCFLSQLNSYCLIYCGLSMSKNCIW